MRISDWSSDVCSSDLAQAQASRRAAMTSFPMLAPRTWRPLGAAWTVALVSSLAVLFIGEVMGQAPCNLCWFQRVFVFPLALLQIGRASCRERVCQYV